MLSKQKYSFQEPLMINGISSVYHKYDLFIIDLWGVLHDGVSPYPKALECIKNLKASGKHIILLSNAPRRAVKAKQTLDNLGFISDLYNHLLTSGELCFDYIKNNPNLGKNYFYIGPEKDRDILNGLDLNEVEKASEANFALATGFEKFGSIFEEKKYELDYALQAGLTLLCANPDFKVVKQTGEEQICSGLMAKYYEENGGKVIYFGKPYELAYKKCAEIFNANNSKKITPNKILCIGDSIHTDIAGGYNSGSSSCLVVNGILKTDLNVDGYLNLTKLKAFCDEYSCLPSYIIKEFFW